MSARRKWHRRSSAQATGPSADTPTSDLTAVTPGSVPEAPDGPASVRRPDTMHHGVSRKDFEALQDRIMQLGQAQDHVVQTVAQARLAVAPIADLRASLNDLARVVRRDERVGLTLVGVIVCVIIAVGVGMAW